MDQVSKSSRSLTTTKMKHHKMKWNLITIEKEHLNYAYFVNTITSQNGGTDNDNDILIQGDPNHVLLNQKMLSVFGAKKCWLD